MDALLSVIPIFMIILVGYVLRYRNIIKSNWTKILNSFVYYISLPALIVYSFTTITWNENGVVSLVGYNLLFIFLATVLVLLLLALMPFARKTKAVILLAATVGNTVYLGVPLVDSAISGSIISSNNGLITAVAVVQLVGALTFALVAFEFYYFGTRKISFIGKQIMTNPLVLSAVVGIGISLVGGWPKISEEIVLVPLKMLAATASPVALLALGSFMHGHRLKKSHVSQLSTVVLIKLALVPLLAFTVMSFSNQSTVNQDITVLLAAMPVAVTAFVISEMYKLDVQFAAVSLLITTILSAFSVTAIANFL